MDDWKLKARAVVKLRRESNTFVSSYPVYLLAVAICTAGRINNAVAIRTADCAAITRWRLFSRIVTPVLSCATS